MADVIYRQDVLDISMKYCPDDDGSCSEPHTDLREMLDEIEDLPSARKQGKWIVVTRHEHYPSGKPYEQLQCPFCKRFDHNGDGSFCGYCGAELEVPKLN